MKWILVVIAVLGFGMGAYVLLRSEVVQTVRLEPVMPLPKNLEPTKAAPAQNPVSSLKPRPTKPIEPRKTPIIQNLPRVTQTPVPPATQTPETATPEPKKTTSPEATVAIPSLTVRQEAGSWRLQAGAFRTQGNAEALKAKVIATGLMARVSQGDDGIYRVLVGNYASSAMARADSNNVLSALR